MSNCLKFTLLLGFATMSAGAATITSGSLTINSQGYGSFNLTLSDGFSVSNGYYGPNDGGSPYVPECRIIAGDPCIFAAAGYIGFNNFSNFLGNPLSNGLFAVSTNLFPITLGLPTQTTTIPFTVSGTIYGPSTQTYMPPCALPENVQPYPYCSEQATGSGYVTLTVDRYYPGTYFEIYQLDQESFVFTPQAATPEPATWIACSLSLILLLLASLKRPGEGPNFPDLDVLSHPGLSLSDATSKCGRDS